MDDIDEWLDSQEEDLIRDISQLVRIPSISEAGSEAYPFGKNCADALKTMLGFGRKYGFSTENIDWYCGTIGFGDGRKEISLWNHLDVVPGSPNGIYPSFLCTREGNYLIGRGTQDNKGPAVAVLYVMRYLKDHGAIKNIRIKQVLGCSEECGMQDVKYYFLRNRPSDFSVVADCSFPVCCGEKGICRVTFATSCLSRDLFLLECGQVPNNIPSGARALIGGKLYEAGGTGGHAAFPEHADNALRKLCTEISGADVDEEGRRVINFANAFSTDGYGTEMGIACRDALSGNLTCNLGVIKTKGRKIVFEADIRYPITVSADLIRAELEKRAEEYGFRMEQFTDSPPYYMEADNPLIGLLSDAFAEETGKSEKPYVMGGGTYARKIPNAISFGPGFKEEDRPAFLPVGHGSCHSADECQSLANLKKAIRIYIRALMKIDKFYGGNKS